MSFSFPHSFKKNYPFQSLKYQSKRRVSPSPFLNLHQDADPSIPIAPSRWCRRINPAVMYCSQVSRILRWTRYVILRNRLITYSRMGWASVKRSTWRQLWSEVSSKKTLFQLPHLSKHHRVPRSLRLTLTNKKKTIWTFRRKPSRLPALFSPRIHFRTCLIQSLNAKCLLQAAL